MFLSPDALDPESCAVKAAMMAMMRNTTCGNHQTGSNDSYSPKVEAVTYNAKAATGNKMKRTTTATKPVALPAARHDHYHQRPRQWPTASTTCSQLLVSRLFVTAFLIYTRQGHSHSKMADVSLAQIHLRNGITMFGVFSDGIYV